MDCIDTEFYSDLSFFTQIWVTHERQRVLQFLKHLQSMLLALNKSSGLFPRIIT